MERCTSRPAHPRLWSAGATRTVAHVRAGKRRRVFEKGNICVRVSLLPLVWMMRKGIGALSRQSHEDGVVPTAISGVGARVWRQATLFWPLHSPDPASAD